MMTPAKIRALRDAATPEPWSVFDQERDPRSRGMGVTGPHIDICNMSNLRSFRNEAAANAALIAAAPTLATIAADALDEVAQLREALDQIARGRTNHATAMTLARAALNPEKEGKT